MTRKRIRYSELGARPAPSSATAPAAPAAIPVTAPAQALTVESPAVESPAGASTAREAPVTPPTPRRAPDGLARALADARAREAAGMATTASASPRSDASVSAVVAATVVTSQPTALSARDIALRLTPARATRTIPRPTLSRPSVIIPAHAAPAPPVACAGAGGLAAEATSSLRERARNRRGSAELLVFAVGHEWFGIDLSAVEEAIDLPRVRHIPEMPPAMLGVITVRSTLTPVYSPAVALGSAAASDASALIFRRARGRLAIAVDDVDDVHTVDLAQLRDVPGLDARDGLLLGVLRYRTTLLALVDAEALIAACQTVPVLETA
jgi:purine-binding chemotaxis protein CheW